MANCASSTPTSPPVWLPGAIIHGKSRFINGPNGPPFRDSL